MTFLNDLYNGKNVEKIISYIIETKYDINKITDFVYKILLFYGQYLIVNQILLFTC